ncbi:acetylornithine/succinyldiaminopimelate/putrescine aminotransferase [Natronospira proteinivora]|uniref:Acetylornithine/succinyldiaminopimelate/putresci ne aminotransferase n=1 Tax=Natronospira proteinivora TaxID=1807133 RepID=A0ABT1G9R1_9GAMM|nr:aspartate aminotransferase family protein [Natronospira proteinivora]MCP1727782.1 acetylornithine/succinyldiaminopimelate/putrescine aminotransferase [Natronospira proteinivora]
MSAQAAVSDTSAASSALLATYPAFPFAIESGQGERIEAQGGRSYLDLYGGHCVALTGHAHPAVVSAVNEQMQTLPFYSMAARLPIRDQAAQGLANFAPAGLDRVFFCNSGAEANENALRLAAVITGRSRFLAFDGAFHGRSQLALSVSDVPGLHARAPQLQAPVDRLPFGDMAALEAADLDAVAAVIVEPIQSMAGVRGAATAWFQALRQRCDAAGTLLIFDEIQTGMGRLGTPFAADLHGVTPDLLTTAKGLASGFPMAALLMRQPVADALEPGDLGSTFGGGPAACAALQATLAVIEQEQLMTQARSAESALRRGLAGSVVRQVRGVGLLLGLDAGDQAPALKDWLLAQGILVGASKDPAVLRLMPPLNLSPQAISTFIAAVHGFSGTGPGKEDVSS